MKVGVITFHWAMSVGARMQCIALVSAIKQAGHEVEVINYLPSRSKFFHILLHYFKRNSTIRISDSKGLENSLKIKLLRFLVKAWRGVQAKKSLDAFSNRSITLTQTFHTPEQLRKNPPVCDAIITGSDQIWNTLLPFSLPQITPYFLDFCSKETTRKIAYAASMGGVPFGEHFKEKATSFLLDFNYISVREEDVIVACHECSPKLKAELVADPTFLLTPNDYRAMFEQKKYKKKHLVTSFLQLKETSVLQQLSAYADEQKIDWVDMSTDYNQLAHVNEFADGPEAWLSRISSAELVLTDSFHVTVFSLFFERDFMFVPLRGNLVRGNNRIVGLLKSFNLEDRIVSLSDDTHVSLGERLCHMSPINWSEVRGTLSRKQSEGFDFLNRALS